MAGPGFEFFDQNSGANIIRGRDNRRQTLHAPIPPLIMEPFTDSTVDTGAWSITGGGASTTYSEAMRKQVVAQNTPSQLVGVSGVLDSGSGWASVGQIQFTLATLPTRVRKVKTFKFVMYAGSGLSSVTNGLTIRDVIGSIFSYTFPFISITREWFESPLFTINQSRAVWDAVNTGVAKNMMLLLTDLGQVRTIVIYQAYFVLNCE